ncbi:MAG: hypothetical protein M3Q33_11180, partial [Acidobacteriota bacterium]|nr:hypothetical protein [Acidobacteriota bacterium]
MRKIFFVSLVFFIVNVTLALPQAKQNTVSQLPEVEPFKITRGSSFSASIPNKTGQTQSLNAAKNDNQNISQDFSDALEIIRKNYIHGKQIDYNELTKTSITTMLRVLDP